MSTTSDNESWDAGEDPTLTGEDITPTSSTPTSSPKPAVQYISRIESNLPDGSGNILEQDYARFHLFYGDTGAGKSMRTRAVQYLVSGGMADMQGRAWMRDKSMLKGVTTDGEIPSVSGVLQRGDTIITVSSEEGVPGVVLAFEDVRSALTGSPDSARKFLSTHIDVSEEQVYTALGSSLRDAYDELATTAPPNETTLQTLLSVRDQASARMRDITSQKKGLVKVREAAQSSTVTAPSDKEIAEARRRVEEAATARADARRAFREAQQKGEEALKRSLGRTHAADHDPAHMDRITRIARLEEYVAGRLAQKQAAADRVAQADEIWEKARTDLAQAQAAAQQAEADAQTIQDQVDQTQGQVDQLPPSSEFVAVYEHLDPIARAHIDRGAARCAFCGAHHGVEAIAEKARKHIQTANVVLETERQRRTLMEAHSTLMTTLADVKGTWQTAQAHVEDREQQVARAATDRAQAAEHLSTIKAEGSEAYQQLRALKVEHEEAMQKAEEAAEESSEDAQRDSPLERILQETADAYDTATETWDAANVALNELLKRQHSAGPDMSKIIDQIDALEARWSTMKRLKKRVAEAYDQLVAEGLGGFEERVNAHLDSAALAEAMGFDSGSGESFTFGLRFTPSFEWGIVRHPQDEDPEIHPFASGGQGVFLWTAICCAIAERAPGILHVIVPEERGISPKPLRAFMAPLPSTAPPNVQILLTNIDKPFRGAVAGWEITHVE